MTFACCGTRGKNFTCFYFETSREILPIAVSCALHYQPSQYHCTVMSIFSCSSFFFALWFDYLDSDRRQIFVKVWDHQTCFAIDRPHIISFRYFDIHSRVQDIESYDK